MKHIKICVMPVKGIYKRSKGFNRNLYHEILARARKCDTERLWANWRGFCDFSTAN